MDDFLLANQKDEPGTESLTKILELILGNKVTIRRGFYSGLYAGIPVVILIAVYLALTQNFSASNFSILNFDTGGIFVLGYLLLLFVLLFLFVGGRAVGWSLTRPLAVLLTNLLPEVDDEIIWGFCNALVWGVISTLILNPSENAAVNFEGVIMVAIILLSLVIGFWGGRKGVINNKLIGKESREPSATGGVVAGTLLGGWQVIINAVFAIGESNPQLAEVMLDFCIQITFYSLISVILFSIIHLILSLLFLSSRVKKQAPIVCVLAAGIVWFFLGAIFLGFFADSDLTEIIIPVVVVALCGACGGFAMSRFYGEETLDEFVEDEHERTVL